MYTDEELAAHADTTLERVRQMEATLKGVAEPVRLFRARTAP